MIRLLFLGKLADLAGGESLEIAPGDEGLSWPELTDQLPQVLAAGLQAETIKVAVNGALVADKAALIARDGDEIAFLPPVSGG